MRKLLLAASAYIGAQSVQIRVAGASGLFCAVLLSIIEQFVHLSHLFRFIFWMCAYIPTFLVISKLYKTYWKTKSLEEGKYEQ